MSKKKLLFCSNFSKASTGFGRHSKVLLSYLYSTGKFEIVEYATSAGNRVNDPALKVVPWKAYGCLPDNPNEVEPFKNNPHFVRQISYGGFCIDNVILQEKPDFVIACEDVWAYEGAEQETNGQKIVMPAWWNRPWWGKIPCVIWTPVDSIPIYPTLKQVAEKTADKELNSHLWVKADFARKELNKLGFEHVKTYPGLIDSTPFKPVDLDYVMQVRRSFNISDDTYLFGFVFRNQLRKLVPTLLEGFKQFRQNNPDIKAKLLLHTNWTSGGWDIPRQIDFLGINKEEVLCTYVCQNCKKILIKSFEGPRCNCLSCGTEGSVRQPDADFGITEDELNILYNMMRKGGYIHCHTSGGFEFPILEAILAGTRAATVPYACGLEYTENNIADVIDSHIDVWECGSQFLKAQPKAEGVAQTMLEFCLTDKEETDILSMLRRERALELFESNQWCKKVENFLDNQPKVEYDFDFKPFNHSDFDMERFFYPTNKKRLLYIMPASNGDCYISRAVLEGLKEVYSLDEWDFYVATQPQYFEVFRDLDYISNIIPYHPIMDNYKEMEGIKDHKGYVDVCLHPYFLTQRMYSYHHNGLDCGNLN